MVIETQIPRMTWIIGHDIAQPVTVTDSAGANLNMTGYALEFVIRRTLGGPILYTATTGGATISISTYTATITIADTDTDDWDPGPYVWTLRRTNAGARVPIAAGTVEMTLLA